MVNWPDPSREADPMDYSEAMAFAGALIGEKPDERVKMMQMAGRQIRAMAVQILHLEAENKALKTSQLTIHSATGEELQSLARSAMASPLEERT